MHYLFFLTVQRTFHRKAFVQIAKVSCLIELDLSDFIGQGVVWTLPFVAKENKQMQSAEDYVKPEEFSQA